MCGHPSVISLHPSVISIHPAVISVEYLQMSIVQADCSINLGNIIVYFRVSYRCFPAVQNSEKVGIGERICS